MRVEVSKGGNVKLNFIINALTHCDWKDCTAQLVEEVQDRHVLLVATGHTEGPYFKLKAECDYDDNN
jgi:hypothetical protein